MRDLWLQVIDRVLRPARPDLERCVREGERHRQQRRAADEARAREVSGCEARIVSLREQVFSANDGVVTSRMTALEREWRALSRRDPDAGLMDLWQRIAPAAWIDRKLWRDSAPDDRLDAAVALAADRAGVEDAERAAETLSASLAAWGTCVGRRVRWRLGSTDFEGTAAMLTDVVTASTEALAAVGAEAHVHRRAEQLERTVHEAARERLPQRGALAKAIAHAAYVDQLCRVAPIGRPNPVTPLRDLWSAGYALAAADAAGVTLAVAPL
ncbi:MAG: hypothetical protein KC657_31025 [Myxococcales bacterium]|nr:hypothetical protein [Myxococcales bacterium]